MHHGVCFGDKESQILLYVHVPACWVAY